jgi:hypothetical protein
MILRCQYQVTDRVMCVPYPSGGRRRTNRGFIDLRGHPTKTIAIPEAASSPGLQCLLECAAAADAPLFSIGCALGRHRERRLAHSHVAGGYVQLARRDYAAAELEDYWRLAEETETTCRAASRGYRWRVTFLGGRCTFRFGWDPEVTAPSLLVYFWALGKTSPFAKQSREALIGAIRGALFPRVVHERLRSG